MKELTPEILRPPFGRYAHGTSIPAGWRVVRTSGQLGKASDDSIPDSAFDQAIICFENIREILRSDGMTPGDIEHVSAYVNHRAHMAEYMGARDALLRGTGRLPSSTSLIVSGFT